MWGKQETYTAVEEIVNGRTALPFESDREEVEACATAAPCQGMISGSGNSQKSVAKHMPCTKEQKNK